MRHLDLKKNWHKWKRISSTTFKQTMTLTWYSMHRIMSMFLLGILSILGKSSIIVAVNWCNLFLNTEHKFCSVDKGKFRLHLGFMIQSKVQDALFYYKLNKPKISHILNYVICNCSFWYLLKQILHFCVIVVQSR